MWGLTASRGTGRCPKAGCWRSWKPETGTSTGSMFSSGVTGARWYRASNAEERWNTCCFLRSRRKGRTWRLRPSGSPLFFRSFSRNRFTCRMFQVHLPVVRRRPLACVGIAVFAKVGAGVVFPDILGDHAAAGRPLSRVFPVVADEISVAGEQHRAVRQGVHVEVRSGLFLDTDSQCRHQLPVFPRQPRDQVSVYAPVARYPVSAKVQVLAAGGQFQAPALVAVQAGKSSGQFFHGLPVPFTVRDTAAIHVGLDPPVGGYVREAEHEFFRAAVYLRPYLLNLFQQGVYGNAVRQYQRVEPPDDRLLAKYFGKGLESPDTFLQRGDSGLQPVLLIVVQSELDIAADAFFFQDRQVRQERFRVFRPEDDESRVLEGHVAFHPVERVVPDGVSGFKPVKEPVRVESGDVGASARGYDFRSLGFHAQAVYIQCDFFPGHGNLFYRVKGQTSLRMPVLTVFMFLFAHAKVAWMAYMSNGTASCISTSSGSRESRSSAIAPFCGMRAGKSVLPGL